jgi:hypothetical protein
MSSNPKPDLRRLRHIGWTLWDPICLLADPAAWESAGFADEYDTYLLRAAELLRSGGGVEAVADYLIRVETEYIGISRRADTAARADSVARAIAADPGIWR